MMKTRQRALYILAGTLIAHVTFGQGSLTPSAPPGPTMKTLQQIEPRTPISSLPYEITNSGSYYLTANLDGPPGLAGISIHVNHVSLDLNGFTLKGGSNSGWGIGVDASNLRTNLHVYNGVLQNWSGGGVDAAAMANVQLEKLRVSDNGGFGGIRVGQGALITACFVNHNSHGISTGQGASITDCVAQYNSGHGFSVIGNGCLVTRCTSSFNTGRGFNANGNALLRDCSAAYNQSNGIYAAAGSTVENCNVANNLADGILVTDFCRVINNHACFNGSNGNTNFAGIHATSFANLIDANTTLANNRRGIKVDAQGGGNTVTRNRSYGQGAGNYDIAPLNDVGPITTPANATNAWSNLQ